jgi:hypothetical protein
MPHVRLLVNLGSGTRRLIRATQRHGKKAVMIDLAARALPKMLRVACKRMEWDCQEFCA